MFGILYFYNKKQVQSWVSISQKKLFWKLWNHDAETTEPDEIFIPLVHLLKSNLGGDGFFLGGDDIIAKWHHECWQVACC